MKLFRPDMVFFDYGGTLIDEGHYCAADGLQALLDCTEHPAELDCQALLSLWREDTSIIERRTHPDQIDLEIPLQPMLRCVLARAGCTTALSPVELEMVFHRANAVHTAMADAADGLAMLREKAIRTSVVSNITLSGEALRQAIADCLPAHSFEFVITSADYVFCKPCPLLFEVALRTARVDPARCWFVGNSFSADICGAASVGLYPILLDPDAPEAIRSYALPDSCGGTPFCRVNSWKALNSLISAL